MNGTVTDPTGATIRAATIIAVNVETGARRETVSDDAGRYLLPQMQPGAYRVTATAAGFADVQLSSVRLLVNSPATVNLAFVKVGTLAEAISVTAEAAQVNTTDATIGNAYGSRPILQLPLEARNVVGLLALQPGVTFIGETQTNSRNGAVNGGKSDQANVTLDGVDVNEQQDRSAFTSVLRVTLDSVQEFRVTTTNANADQGRSSGAQIALVTKSGGNELHGSLYEFHRNTVTTANSFFNKLANPAVARPKLIRNTFGAAIGGPVKKNRLFYFFNYEGRRDAKESTVERTVPNADFRQGIVKYVRADNSTATLSPAQVRELDPKKIGADAEVLKLFQSYPLPNTTTIGDGLNTAGFRFVAPRPLRWNTYVARLDYNLTDSGRHTIFARGNLQNDRDVSTPQFPGEPPSGVNLNNSKGLAIGYNVVLKPNLTGAFRYGFTRQGVESSGLLTSSYVNFLSLSDRYSFATSSRRIIPVHNPSGDLTWIRGSHTVSAGGQMRRVTNSRDNYANSFHSAQVRSTRLLDSGASLDPPGINSRQVDAYRTQMVNLLGVISTGTAKYNYDLEGNVQPVGSPVSRDFRLNEYEMYVQDAWRVTRSLMVTAGLRYSLSPPIYELNELQISLVPSLGAWFDARGGLAQQGKPASQVTPIRYVPSRDPGGSPLYEFQKLNFAPRLAVAYSPTASSGLLARLLGGPGATSIRAGWGMYYDAIGNSLILRSDAGSFGLSTSLEKSSVYTAADGPRFDGTFAVPGELVPPPPKFTFPITAPNSFAYGSSVTNIDSQIRSPYTMNINFSVGREFKGGFFVQAAYVGRLSRRSLAQTDPATPPNLLDPASGTTYWEAATELARLARARVPVAAVQRVPFFENLWNAPATGGLTATQAIYNRFVARGNSYTNALQDIDMFCNPSCSKLGPNTMFDKQFSSITTWRSIAGGNYHGMQWTVRQRLREGVEATFNYTWSKSTDLSSRAEADGTGPSFGFITNPWNPGQMKAVSDYDMTQQWNLNLVGELPFGKGKRFLNSGGIVDAIFGGWQISGLYRQSTGLPISVRNGSNWPTNWQWQGFATNIGPVEGMQTTKNAPAVSGGSGPNAFVDPRPVLAAYDFTYPGQVGQRNGIRGDGYFTIDTGLSKSFRMPYSEKHSLQIRWEAFNVTNSVRFDVASLSINLGTQGTFGKYSDVLTQPRVMQFGARYEF
jgi:hypothetical protein